MENYNTQLNQNTDTGLTKLKTYLSANKKMFTSLLSTVLILVMAGFAVYFAYSYKNRSLNAKKAGAANPACYLELQLAPPTPSATPIACNKMLDIVLVMDRSSSMNSVESDGRTKLQWAKEAAASFVQALINSGTTSVRVGVSSFGAQGNDGTGTLASRFNSTLEIPLTNNLQNVLTSINNIKYIDKGTCIQCGIRIGNTQLTSANNKKVEIVLSDGKANRSWIGTSSQNNKTLAINEAKMGRSKGIEYRTLGYGLKASGTIDEPTLIAIAGSVANYQYKPNVADWSAAFLTILRDICGTTPTRTSTPISTVYSTPRSSPLPTQLP